MIRETDPGSRSIHLAVSRTPWALRASTRQAIATSRPLGVSSGWLVVVLTRDGTRVSITTGGATMRRWPLRSKKLMPAVRSLSRAASGIRSEMIRSGRRRRCLPRMAPSASGRSTLFTSTSSCAPGSTSKASPDRASGISTCAATPMAARVATMSAAYSCKRSELDATNPAYRRWGLWDPATHSADRAIGASLASGENEANDGSYGPRRRAETTTTFRRRGSW